MRTWISTNAFFRNDSYSDEVFEELSDDQQKELRVLRKFRFVKEQVVIYNVAKDEAVTLRFENGYCITVEMTIEEADKIFITK